MMKIRFRIDYCTVWGEEVRVKILRTDGTEFVLPLSTSDGKKWEGDLTISGDIVYQYCIYYNGEPTRVEWNINKRRICDLGKNRTCVRIDAWRNRSDFSCFYSSAFTACIRTRKKKFEKSGSAAVAVQYARMLEIRVSAPQLTENQSLHICGNQGALGNWDSEKGLEMQQDSNLLEWYVLLDASRLKYPLEYKCCACEKDTNKVIDWEIGDNHVIKNSSFDEGRDITVFSDLLVSFARTPWRGTGTAIPIFSLKTKRSFGVGDFGDLKKMIDWIVLTHQRVLQLLPLNDTTMTHTWTDSYPYCGISIYALHPMYMDLNRLGKLNDRKKAVEFGRMQKELNDLPQVDYERVNKVKWEYICSMFEQEGAEVLASSGFKTFFEGNEYWLMPYAAFSFLRDKYATSDFHEWKDDAVYDEKKVKRLCASGSKVYSQIAIYYYVQYNLHLQLTDACGYARKNHVVLKGDVPIGVGRNSVETWTESHYFNLDEQAGAPPDDFSTKGQNWGFPTYNWNEMAQDGYRWWKNRFKQMAQYFDAYRIDHILGFFRIWEIPIDAVHGLLGQFSPSLPMSIEEIQSYGLSFCLDFYTRPYITDGIIDRIFGIYAEKVKSSYLHHTHDDKYEMLPEYNTQRKVETFFKGKDDAVSNRIREGLYSLISNVLFVHDRKNSDMFHPRIAVQSDFVYDALNWKQKEAFNRLYENYYYHRHNQFWRHEAMKKLPQLINSTRMLPCGEDLGMIPDCVESVMNELHILSLELQRMPKKWGNEFGHVDEYPYYSVCTFSSHDTSTLREWWEEDKEKTSLFFKNELHQHGEIPASATGKVCEMVIDKQLHSNSIFTILSFQDWLSIDEKIRYPNVKGERINIPAHAHHHWCYRMHLTIEELIKNDVLNTKIGRMIDDSGRYME